MRYRKPFALITAISALIMFLFLTCTKKPAGPDVNDTIVTDIDGNVYHTVTIGTQTWMVENLKTTRYNDGTAIPFETSYTAWSLLTNPGYCWYKNDITYKNTYGALYNWYAVGTGKLAPTGWHVPTDADWEALVNYLGGSSVAGGKLKEEGTAHWNPPNTGATNERGFSALPGGCRDSSMDRYLGEYGVWWSATENDSIISGCRFMSTYDASANRYGRNKKGGFSIRCIRNSLIDTTDKPVIISDPQPRTVNEGQTATFKVAVVCTKAFSYFWQKNGLDISGANDSIYTTPATTKSDSGALFRCIVSNNWGSDTSANAVLNVLSIPEWKVGVAYNVGDIVMYQGKKYKCTTAHTSYEGWEPPNAPTLWQLASLKSKKE